jgi:hypothetical protein
MFRFKELLERDADHIVTAIVDVYGKVWRARRAAAPG